MNPTWDETVEQDPLIAFSWYLSGRKNCVLEVGEEVLVNLDEALMPAAKMESPGKKTPVTSNRSPAGWDPQNRDLLIGEPKSSIISARQLLGRFAEFVSSITPADVLRRHEDSYDRQRIPYAFIGGIALNAWGVPRATFDLDLTLSVSAKGMDVLLDELRRGGAVIEAVFEGGFRDRVAGMEKIHVHLPAGTSLLAVDLFLATTPFLESVLSRRVAIDLGRGPVWVCTAADLILFKLVADRSKDRVDLEDVTSVQGVPEHEYLLRWAEVLDVGPRLAALLERHG